MSTNLKVTDEATFESDVLSSKDLVLVDFWAPWCGPCNRMLPLLEELAETVTVFKVNIDENPKLAVRYGVSAVPTLVFIREGQLLRKLVGIHPKDLLVSEIERFKVSPVAEPVPEVLPVADTEPAIQQSAPLPEARQSAPLDVPAVAGGEGQAVS